MADENKEVDNIPLEDGCDVDSSISQHYYLRGERLALGLCFLLFSCWYKIEGVVFLVSALCMLAIFASKDVVKCLKSHPWRTALPPFLVFLFILSPWWITVLSYGLNSRDFAFSAIAEVDVNRFKAICGEFIRELTWNRYDAGVLSSMSLALLFAVAGWWRIKRFFRKNYYSRMVVQLGSPQVMESACATCFVAGLASALFFFAFFASVMPLWWHLQSVKRILLTPEVIFVLTSLAYVSHLKSNTTEIKKNNRFFLI